jgi:hypothetical protein
LFIGFEFKMKRKLSTTPTPPKLAALSLSKLKIMDILGGKAVSTLASVPWQVMFLCSKHSHVALNP